MKITPIPVKILGHRNHITKVLCYPNQQLKRHFGYIKSIQVPGTHVFLDPRFIHIEHGPTHHYDELHQHFHQ